VELHKELQHRRSDLIEFVKQSKPSTVRSLFDVLVLCWGNIILSFWLFLRFPSVWTYAIAFLMVSSRMNACLTLAHDAWHNSLMPSRKWNDFFGGWLCSYPFGSVYGKARAGHLAHHKYLGTGLDPDRPLHVETDKDTPAHFVGHFSGHMFVGQLTAMLSAQLKPVRKHPAMANEVVAAATPRRDRSDTRTRPKYPEFFNLVLVQVAIGSALWSASGQWWMYFALWLLPIVTLGTLCYFLRAFADHARLATDPEGPYEGRLITIAHQLPWERAFIAPFEFNFHAEHHLYASVPHQYLPRVHELIKDNEAYQRQCIVRRNYTRFLLAYWRQICSASANVAFKGDRNVAD